MTLGLGPFVIEQRLEPHLGQRAIVASIWSKYSAIRHDGQMNAG